MEEEAVSMELVLLKKSLLLASVADAQIAFNEETTNPITPIAFGIC